MVNFEVWLVRSVFILYGCGICFGWKGPSHFYERV